MKTTYKLKAVFILLSLICSIVAIAKEPAKKIVIADAGFATPESVEYSAIEDVYLVQHPAITTNYFMNIWYPIEI